MQQQPRARAPSVVIRAARSAWGALRVGLRSLISLVAALILLFEDWGWKPLAEALGWLARFRLVQRVEAWVTGLPPYGAMAVFVLPATLLFPLKLVALWLLARGMVVSAGALFIGAKITSTAIVARIFMLTKPALMRIAWFARTYNWMVPWQESMFAAIRASWAWRYGRVVKHRVLSEARVYYARIVPMLQSRLLIARRQLTMLGRQARGKIAAMLRGFE